MQRGERDGSDQGSGGALGPDERAAVVDHLNGDHAQDCLLIARTLGGRPDARAARARDVDGVGLTLDVDGPGADGAVVTVPWADPVATRADVRPAVVRLSDDARRLAGRAPRGAHA